MHCFSTDPAGQGERFLEERACVLQGRAAIRRKIRARIAPHGVSSLRPRAQPAVSWTDEQSGKNLRRTPRTTQARDWRALAPCLHAACGFGEGNGGGWPCADGDEDVGQRKRVVANLTTGAARNRQGVCGVAAAFEHGSRDGARTVKQASGPGHAANDCTPSAPTRYLNCFPPTPHP